MSLAQQPDIPHYDATLPDSGSVEYWRTRLGTTETNITLGQDIFHSLAGRAIAQTENHDKHQAAILKTMLGFASQAGVSTRAPFSVEMDTIRTLASAAFPETNFHDLPSATVTPLPVALHNYADVMPLLDTRTNAFDLQSGTGILPQLADGA